MRHPVIWAAIIVAAGLLAGTAAAQWWNPFETKCEKHARKWVEKICDKGNWTRALPLWCGGQSCRSEEECRTWVYGVQLATCRDGGFVLDPDFLP